MRTNIRLLHWNTQELTDRVKIVEFKSFIKHQNFDIVLLNETWYTANRGLPKLSGYTHIFTNRERGKKVGGLALYHKTDLYVTITDTTNRNMTNTERLD